MQSHTATYDEIHVPAFYKFASFLLVLFNGLCSTLFAGGFAGADISYVIGAIIGGVFLFPFIVIAIGSVFPGNRNSRFQYKALFWTSLILALLNAAKFLSVAAGIAASVQS